MNNNIGKENLENMSYEPKILGFFCKWCTSAAADLAGTSRMQYPPNIRPIMVWCSGTVDPAYIIRSLLEGADAVVVGGCHPGDCHYINGNYKTRRRIKLMKTIFGLLGLGEERIFLKWISASEGAKFTKTMSEITERIKKLGPNELGKRWNT